MRRNALGIVTALLALMVILAATLYYGYASFAVPGEALPEAGWVALVFGVLFSMLVGVGLMALLFYSSRRGYDEPPHFESDGGANSPP